METATLDSLRGLYVFAHVAETQSFSRAAERLRITKSAVSKHVAQLEAQLGVQLIVRSTRKLVLTEAGERVYASSAQMAGEAQAAQEAAHQHSSKIAGTLRITAPSALARIYLMPLVRDFCALHPDIAIELLVGDTFVDLVAERVDVALRIGGGRTDSSLVSRRVARVELLVVASPEYLIKHGTPRTPSDLAAHEWLVHSPNVNSVTRITLSNGKRTETIEGRGRVYSNDGPTNIAGALAGLGLLAVPDFEVAHEVHSGSLVRLLPSWRINELALHLVFPPRKHVLARVRAFSDFIAERFTDPPWSCAQIRRQLDKASAAKN
jgi:DNA-binding transcriptional LysR family regulator